MVRIRRTMSMIAACAVLALAGCTASVETTEDANLPQAELEKGIADALEKSVGQRPDAVDCPDPVKAKVGESARCVLRAGNVRYGLTATITSYDKDSKSARYEVKVDDKPIG